MSGSSNNSWTLVTPEGTDAETLRPLAEGGERQHEPSAPTEDFGAKHSEFADVLPVEDHLKSEEETTNQNEETNHASVPDLDGPASADAIGSSVPDTHTEDPPACPPLDSAVSSAEPESFSDSYTHLSPCSDETQASTTETLGHLDSEQEEEEAGGQTDIHDETQHLNTESHLDTDSTVESEDKPETSAQEAEPELRGRRSLLAALERIDRTDEEEEAEEDFQLPQREEDSGITLNKCILGAVILLGLGTIFISGVFMDLDEEGDNSTSVPKDTETPGKQDVARIAAEADTAELLNKLAKGNEHIAVLQAQLQSQNEELKAAKAQAAEGTTRLQEEVEKENTAVGTPPSGQTEDINPELIDQQVQTKKGKHDMGERKEWKDERSEVKKEKKPRKDEGKTEGKEWKKDKSESGQFEKRQKTHKEHEDNSKHSSESKEWKKDKSKKGGERGDEGKPWKDKNEKKDWKDKNDKKSKHDKVCDEHWKSKEEKRDLKEGKQQKDRYQSDGEKEWKKERDYHKESKNRKNWKAKDSQESKNKGERKPWSEDKQKNSKDEKKWKKRDDRKYRKSEEEERNNKHKEQWRGERSDFDKHKHKSDHKEHTWTERKPAHSHKKKSPSQPEYWEDQRNRIQHSTRPLQPCDTPDTCAQSEGVHPVHFNEFDRIFQNYISKAQTAGVDASQIEQLQKLAAEFFKNGVFVHDQMSFQEYVEDVGDILEDLVEGEHGQDSALEDEMEGFEREVMQKFAMSGSGEQERVKGEWRKEAKGRG